MKHFIFKKTQRGENMKKIISMLLGAALIAGLSVSSANAKTLKCQTVINAKADEVVMLKDFGQTVS